MTVAASPMRRGGFSLVELLVSIGVVGIVIGLTLPALAAVRVRATEAKSLSNVRQLSGVIFLYADGSDGQFPAIEEGRYYPNLNGTFAFPYWQVYLTWTGVVWDVLPYNEAIEVYVSPGSPRIGTTEAIPWPTSYHYSTSFAAQPTLWTADVVWDRSLARAARTDQVRFPASKALLWDDELPLRRDRRKGADGDLLIGTPMAMADGSAGVRVPVEAVDALPNFIVNPVSSARLHNTPGGVLGRDY